MIGPYDKDLMIRCLKDYMKCLYPLSTILSSVQGANRGKIGKITMKIGGKNNQNNGAQNFNQQSKVS